MFKKIKFKNEETKNIFEFLVKVALVVPFLIFSMCTMEPYKETLTCFKVQNLCEHKSEYINKKEIEYIPLGNLKNISIKRFAGHYYDDYFLEYNDNPQSNLSISLINSAYSSRNGAEKAKTSILNYLNSSENKLVITKYDLFAPIITLFLIIICLILIIIYLIENNILKMNNRFGAMLFNLKQKAKSSTRTGLAVDEEMNKVLGQALPRIEEKIQQGQASIEDYIERVRIYYLTGKDAMFVTERALEVIVKIERELEFRKSADNYTYLAEVYGMIGNDEARITNYNMALDIDPYYIPALCGLGDHFSTSSNSEKRNKARMYFHKILEVEPENQVAIEGLKFIESK